MAEMHGKRGRPRKYQRDDQRYGAPDFHLRLEPDLHTWVQSRGGVAWIRQVLRGMQKQEVGPMDPEGYLKHLATQQRVGPIADIGRLRADFWPFTETADDLLAAVDEWRHEAETPRP